MAKIAICSGLFFVFVFCVDLTVVRGDNNTEHESCALWSQIASQLTSSTGAQQTCKRGTEPCTRIDCRGAYVLNDKGSVFLQSSTKMELDYCFGIILNHCDNPISLDFYLQVPERNVSRHMRVFHNTLLPIPGLQYRIGNVGSAEAFLYFEMERPKGLDQVTFSMTVKIRLTARGREIWPEERRLISEETVPVPTCTPADNVTAPPPALDQCHPPKWKEDSGSQETDKTGRKILKSGSLGKKCNDTTPCKGAWLVCDRNTFTCKCDADFLEVKTAENSSFCSPKSNLNMPCSGDDVCPYYMHVKCVQGFCACIDGYTPNYQRHICEKQYGPAGPTTTAAVQPQPSVAPHSSQKSKGKGHSKAAVIAGSVIGGVVVLAGILIAAYFAIRRLRSPYRNGELLLENEDSGVI